jgi:hypothetical protein
MASSVCPRQPKRHDRASSEGLEPVKGHPHNPGLAEPFYCESSEPASPADFLKNAKLLGKQDAEIVQIQAKRDDYWRQCQDAQAALKVAEAVNVTTIQDEAARRAQRLREVEDNLQNLKSQRDALNSQLERQTAYVYRSELLDCLCTGQSAVNPRNLGNALAGLPPYDLATLLRPVLEDAIQPSSIRVFRF